MSSDLPTVLAAERNACHRRLGVAFAVFMASLYAISKTPSILTLLVEAATFVGVCVFTYRLRIYEKELPFLQIEHEYQKEERRLEAIRRNEERKQRAEEARRAFAEAERGRREGLIQMFGAVLDCERGSKIELSTSLGRI